VAILSRLYHRPLLLWGLYAVAMLIVALRADFAILANDAFPLLFQAEQMSASYPRSWYNGFFPIGYPLLLKALLLFGRAHIDHLAVLTNIAAVAGLFYFGRRLFDRLDIPTEWKLIGLFTAALLPEMIRGVLSIRPDFLVVVAAIAAFVFIAERKYLLAGTILGIGYLFRSHTLVLIGAAALVMAYSREWRSAMRILMGAAPWIVMQGILNMAAGESFLASSQGFNVAKLMYGVDWKTDTQITNSAFSIIGDDPGLFLSAWAHHLIKEWYLLVILCVGILRVQTRELSAIAVIYLVIVGTGGSPRGSLPVQPVGGYVLLGIISARLSALDVRFPWLTSAAAAFITLATIGASLQAAGRSRARIERYDHLARALDLNSPGAVRTVLTDDFSLYFPSLANAEPRVNGGWGVVGVPIYRERYPQFVARDSYTLRRKLIQEGVQYVVLLTPTQDPHLAKFIESDSTLFPKMTNVSGYSIYRVR
jgi:hypothetical protein